VSRVVTEDAIDDVDIVIRISRCSCVVDPVDLDVVGIYMGLYGLGPLINCEIPNKSQKLIHVSKRGCGNSLVPPCSLKWRYVVILKYGSHLHFFKSSVRRSKRSPHALARLAGLGGAKGAGVRHLREWSAEIRLLALRERDLLLLFSFLVFGFLAFKLHES
jgi:hypothetical protein